MSAEAERWRTVTDLRHPSRADVDVWDAGDALLAALEARDREHDAAIGRMVGEIEARDRIITELEAGLRDMRDYRGPDREGTLIRKVRDLLAGRVVGDPVRMSVSALTRTLADLRADAAVYRMTVADLRSDVKKAHRRISELEAGLRRIGSRVTDPWTHREVRDLLTWT